jgi:hypothetical protein
MFDLGELTAVDPHADEAALIAQIDELERVKSAAAAGQARAAAALDQRRRAEEAAAGVPAAQRGRGVASEIGLARRDSPARGNRHLSVASALVHEMPHTLAALECGALSEWRATRSYGNRPACQSRIGGSWMPNCAPMSARWMGWAISGSPRRPKQIAHRLDDRAAAERAAKAAADRRVSIRPGPDAMTYVTALLPVAQGAGVYTALNKTVEVMH